MTIQEQFNRVAGEYDRNRRKFIPCFDDYYKTTTDMIAANIQAPERILDLGAGTGLLSSFWYPHFPQSQYVLTDIALKMLETAKSRFEGLENVTCLEQDYTQNLPDQDFDCIISALSIHHLEHFQKEGLFIRIYEKLPEGGIFVNYDQFCSASPELDDWINRHWERQLETSGLSEADISLWKERRKLDRECSVQAEIKMLENSGFRTVDCLFSNGKFAVIAALK